MTTPLLKGVFIAFVFVVAFHVADNSFRYQSCLLNVTNQFLPDFKSTENILECNGSADGGLFRFLPSKLSKKGIIY